MPEGVIGGAKQGHGGNPAGGGQMHGAAVVTDEPPAAFQQRHQTGQTQLVAQIHHRVTEKALDAGNLLPVFLASANQQWSETGSPQLLAQGSKLLRMPDLVGLGGASMNGHQIVVCRSVAEDGIQFSLARRAVIQW